MAVAQYGEGRTEWSKHWEYDPKWLTLTHKAGYYEVDLERCNTSAQVLDWLVQIRCKTWGTDAVVIALLDAIIDLLDPQAHLCSFGMHKSFDVAKHLRSGRKRA